MIFLKVICDFSESYLCFFLKVISDFSESYLCFFSKLFVIFLKVISEYIISNERVTHACRIGVWAE